MYTVKIPSIVKPLARDLLWSMPASEKALYLTFDDGPTPGVTEQALDMLAQYNAKATFFCLGKQAEAHPELFARIRAEGHTIGLHSYDHPDGWKTCTMQYVRNVLRGAQTIDAHFFRPPYGHLTFAQSSLLRKRYKIVMWDVLSADWDASNTPEQCAQNVIRHAESGSIVVFHDSVKAAPRMAYALECTLRHFSDRGYLFKALPQVEGE